MQIINLTPHKVSVMSTEGEMVHYPPSGVLARLEVERKETADISSLGNMFSVCSPKLGKVVDLPAYKAEITYIVSALVAEAMKETRPDLLSPGELIRDENGVITGAKGFCSYSDKWVQHLTETYVAQEQKE